MPVSSDPDEDLPEYSLATGNKEQKVTYSVSCIQWSMHVTIIPSYSTSVEGKSDGICVSKHFCFFCFPRMQFTPHETSGATVVNLIG